MVIPWLKFTDKFSPKEVYQSMIRAPQYLMGGFDH